MSRYASTHMFVCLRLNNKKKKDNDIKWNVFIYKQWDRISSFRFIFVSQVYIIISKTKNRRRNVGKYTMIDF